MKQIWKLFWAAAGIEALCFGLWMGMLPSEAKRAVLFGLSAARLALLLGVFLLGCLCLVLACKAERLYVKKIAGWCTLLFLAILFPVSIFLRPPFGVSANISAIYLRITPILMWMELFAAQYFLFLFVENFRAKCNTSSLKHVLMFLFCCIFLMGSFRLVLVTGMGLMPDSSTFYRQGVSLLEGPFLFAILILFYALTLVQLIKMRAWLPLFLKKWRNGIGFCLIWLVAALLWIYTPFEGRSYFLPALRPPNYNFYPASDAEHYDLLAQNILIGNGFRNGLFVVRPLYVALLSLFHWLAGNNYMAVTNLQIVTLALIPAFLFLIGSACSSFSSGVLVAVWVIAREVYSIQLTPIVQISNSRLLLSDLPMTLLTVMLLFFVIRWVKSASSLRKMDGFIAGGVAGMAMLVRTQAFVYIPVILLVLWVVAFQNKHKMKKALVLSGVFIFGLLVVIMPWTIGNTVYPNQTVSAKSSESAYLVQLLEKSAGISPSGGNESIPSLIVNHPIAILKSAGNHFANNVLSSLLVLPVRENAYRAKEPAQWFFDPTVFWYRENSRGVLTEKFWLIFLYGAICIGGIFVSTWKNKVVGLLPFAFYLSYLAGTSMAMTSGFRFILPVDWVPLFYFGVGIVTLISFILESLLPSVHVSCRRILPCPHRKRTNKFLHLLIVLLFLGIGCLLPLLDFAIPQRFPSEMTQNELFSNWLSANPENQTLNQRYAIESKLQTGELSIWRGRAVYPRIYLSGESDSSGVSYVRQKSKETRWVWKFLDSRVHTVSFHDNEEKSSFPDPIDVFIIGTELDDVIHALWITPIDSPNLTLISDSLP